MFSFSKKSKKDLYIGDFRIRNCSPYGEYKTLKSLDFGDELKIKYDDSEKLIVVFGEKVVENKDDDSKKSESDKKWVAIGELEMPVHIRKVVVPLLKVHQIGDIFECKVSRVYDKQSIDNCLSVTIWVAQ